MLYKNRKERIALLSALIDGTATANQIADLRKSREVIHLTMKLDESDEPQEPFFPQYHIEIDQDWNVIRKYDLYEDGRIELRE